MRLLGTGKVLRAALADLAELPADARERGIAMPLLVHFQLAASESPASKEADVSAEIRAWFEDYERKQRSQSLQEGQNAGERRLMLRLLRARFGELPPAAIARVEAADSAALERWGERMFDAVTLDEVLDDAASAALCASELSAEPLLALQHGDRAASTLVLSLAGSLPLLVPRRLGAMRLLSSRCRLHRAYSRRGSGLRARRPRLRTSCPPTSQALNGRLSEH